jgi:hypothetical protein
MGQIALPNGVMYPALQKMQQYARAVHYTVLYRLRAVHYTALYLLRPHIPKQPVRTPSPLCLAKM